MAKSPKPVKKRGSTQIPLGAIGVILILISLWLPPFSIGSRVFNLDAPAISKEGGIVTEPGGGALSIAGGNLSRSIRVRMDTVWPGQAAENDKVNVAMAALPDSRDIASPFYTFEAHGPQPDEAILVLPMVEGVHPDTLDLYVFVDGEWQWAPGNVLGQDGRVEAVLSQVPEVAVLMRGQLAQPIMSAGIAVGADPLPERVAKFAVVNPNGAFLLPDGTVGGIGDVQNVDTASGVRVLPAVTNVHEGVVRSDWVDNLLADQALRDTHISQIAAWLQLDGLDGVHIAYQDIDPALRDDFTALVELLAAKLHDDGKLLTVQVDAPVRISEDQWDSGAYDLYRIGMAADGLYLPALKEPAAYMEDGQMENLLRWATRQADRSKIHLLISTYSREVQGNLAEDISYTQVLAKVNEMALQGIQSTVSAGAKLSLQLASILESAGLRYDEASQSHWFAYQDEQGQERVVWLENASSVARKLDLVSMFGLRGMAVNNLLGEREQNDAQIWQVLDNYMRDGFANPIASDLAITYSVQNMAGESLAMAVKPLSEPQADLEAPKEPGEYVLAAAIAPSMGQGTPVSSEIVAFTVPSPTPTATDTPTHTSTPMPTFTPTDTPTFTPEHTPTEAFTPTPTYTPTPDADAVITNASLNLREGPGERFRIIGSYRQGTLLTIVSKVQAGDWLEVILPDGKKGWMFAGLMQVNLPEDSIPVNEAPPTPPPVVAAVTGPATARQFGYGIQPDMVTDTNHGRILSHVQQMGFNWIKQQVEWFRYNSAPGQYDWGPLDRIVDSCNAAGIHVMFSVVKAPAWARPPGDTDEGPPADLNTYATFVRELAARYKGRVRAYEIWNEQNLYYEWGGRGGKINARRYVELLKLAYQAIKSVDPGAVVISGAMTPTGWNDGDIAIDDRVYLEQMYQAGMRNYCDAVGAHPSGYNNPPDADWRNYGNPNVSFNATGHPSWFFRGTMESYRNIMVKYGDANKKIWVTEFGWATTHNLGVPPNTGYEYAADITEEQQAQYLVRAIEMGRNWGWVGPMFVWNLNFGPVSGIHDEKAKFGIVRPDWSPRPAFAALAHMGK